MKVTQINIGFVATYISDDDVRQIQSDAPSWYKSGLISLGHAKILDGILSHFVMGHETEWREIEELKYYRLKRDENKVGETCYEPRKER